MDESAFLAALQLADSALPIGRFAHSCGLEDLLRRDAQLGEREIFEVIETAILVSVGPLDAVAVALAHRFAAQGTLGPLVELDRKVTARKLSPGSRHASTTCGTRLAALSMVLTTRDPTASLAARIVERATDGNLPVVMGALAFALEIPCEQAVLLELRGAAASLLSAAVRLGRLSSLRAQACLQSLAPSINAAAREALVLPTPAMSSFAPELEISMLAHHRADARLFVT